MNENKAKRAKEMIKAAAEENQELEESLKELKEMERQMAELAEQVLGSGQTQNEKNDFIGSEADNAMMVLAYKQAKHDPELAAMLKELEESDKQIARVTDILVQCSRQGITRRQKL